MPGIRFVPIAFGVQLLMLATLHAAADVPAPEDLDIYVLCGNTDIAGGPQLTATRTQIIDRCYLLNDKNEWEPARAPLNRYSSVIEQNSTQEIGPGRSFATAMLERNKEKSIGLVVNLADNSLIEDWHMKSRYYRGVRGRTKQAMKSGTLKGVLWIHSANTRSQSPRLGDLKTLAAYLRSDLKDLTLPFVVSELPGARDANSLLGAFSASVHATGIASTEDLTVTQEGKLDPDSLQRLGVRLAEHMTTVQAERAAMAKDRPVRTIALIDSHIHAAISKPGGLDAVDQWMTANNIEHCIAHTLQTSSATMTDDQRATIVSNFSKYKDRIHRFCYFEPDEVSSVEEAVQILEKEKQAGAIGFGEHYGRGLMFDDPRNMRIYEACEKIGFPVMFHIDQNKNMDELNFPHLRHALEAYPKCIFIAHAQWWLQFPSGVCNRMLQEYPNLYTDPSGLRMAGMLNRDRAYTRDFLIRNADKVLFGSDAGWWSIGNTKAEEQQFQIFQDLDLPDDVLTKIYRTNAEKLFSLSP